MINECYPFLLEIYTEKSDVLLFTFISRGIVEIPKAIAFTPIETDGQKYYNWGFGDLVLDLNGNYKIDDQVHSNNGDVKTIFYTVVSTLSKFFDIHPNATVRVRGSTYQRINIYRALIAKHLKYIEKTYDVVGSIDCKNEHFRPNVPYEFILISKKAIVNLSV